MVFPISGPNGISDTEPPAAFPIPRPHRGSYTGRVHRVPNPMPQRGIAYQPRVQTLVLTHILTKSGEVRNF